MASESHLEVRSGLDVLLGVDQFLECPLCGESDFGIMRGRDYTGLTYFLVACHVKSCGWYGRLRP